MHRSLDQGLGDDWLPDAFRQSTPNAVFADATHEVGIARGGTSAVIGKGIYRYLADIVNAKGRVDGYKGPARRGSKRWLDPLYYTEHPLPE